jgi:hypothetical protein
MKACRPVDIHQAFTRDHHPKGNADTERVIRPLHEASLWRQEWTCPVALIQALAGWVADDHEHDLYSALD